MALPNYDDLRRTEEYGKLRSEHIISYDYAEDLLGRELTEAEELAIWDNRQDQMLIEMGR